MLQHIPFFGKAVVRLDLFRMMPPMKSLPAVAVMVSLLLAAVGIALWGLKGSGGSAPDAPPEPTDGEEIPLSYVPEGFPMGLSTTQGFALHLFGQPGSEFESAELPPETGAARTYDRFSIAGAELLTLTEATSPPLVWLDTNGNGDLTDDAGPARGEKEGGVVPNFYTLQLPAPAGGEGFPYRLWIFPSNTGGTRFYAACHMAGELELDGETLKLVLFDADADGAYSDDPVGIDADGDGKLSDSEMLRKGATRELNGTPVTLQAVSADGRSIRLKH